MKRVLVGVMVLLLSVTFVSAVLAQGNADPALQQFNTKLAAVKSMTFEGTVLSHDVLCHCFVVKTAKGPLTFQDDYAKFDQEYNRAKGLTIGAKVKGEYKPLNYLNYALSVEYAK
jgi:hypothetical protein